MPLTHEQFHASFTNALSEADSKAVYERYYIPGSARPFFQAGYANFNPRAATKVDYKNPARPPLLLVTGTEDRICPPSVNEATWKKQRQAPSATEHKEYPGRCHYPGQDGWEEVADFILGWTVEHSNQPSGSPGLVAVRVARRRGGRRRSLGRAGRDRPPDADVLEAVALDLTRLGVLHEAVERRAVEGDLAPARPAA